MSERLSSVVLIPVPSLEFTKGNQLIQNIICNIRVLGSTIIWSPTDGPMASCFAASRAAVRIGSPHGICRGDVLSICICCSIRTAKLVIDINKYGCPVLWIISESYDEYMKHQEEATEAVVTRAFEAASHVIFPSIFRSKFYPLDTISNKYSIIRNGQADTKTSSQINQLLNDTLNVLTVHETAIFNASSNHVPKVCTHILIVGRVCPQNDQKSAVILYQNLLATIPHDPHTIMLSIVGASYETKEEKDYVDEVYDIIDDKSLVSVYNVTDNLKFFYDRSDMVLISSACESFDFAGAIMEAFNHGVPVIAYDVADVSELVTNGVNGFVVPVRNTTALAGCMKKLHYDKDLCGFMAVEARKRFLDKFDILNTVKALQSLVYRFVPFKVAVNMDKAVLDLSNSPKEAIEALCKQGQLSTQESGFLFTHLVYYPGAVAALLQMLNANIRVYLIFKPTGPGDATLQRKFAWVQACLGASWMEKIVITAHVSTLKVDLLIDNPPAESVRTVLQPGQFRLSNWSNWKGEVFPVLKRN